MAAHVKVLSFALVAFMASGALAASSALATEPTLQTQEDRTVTLEGEQPTGFNDLFKLDGSSVECASIIYSTVTETPDSATNIDLHPEYSGCKAFGFANATVATADCNYAFMPSGNESKFMSFNSGALTIECGEAPININAGTCSASIGPQTISTGVEFSNTTTTPTAPGAFDVHTTAAPISVFKNKDGFACPFNGTGNTTGNYTGTATIGCFEDGIPLECYLRNSSVLPDPEPTLQNKENKTVTLKGEQPGSSTDSLDIDALHIECESVTYNALGNVADGSTYVTLHPEYGGCEAFFGLHVAVSTTGCNYTVMAGGQANASMFFNTGNLAVECETGKTVNINVGPCSASIGSQTITTGIRVSNTTNSPSDWDAHTSNAPVAVTKNADEGTCPFNGTGNTIGHYTGTATVRCFDAVNGAQIDCEIV
jgi:hypothetical protein